MGESPIVQVEQGQLQGRKVTSESGKDYYTFFGIPYAKPPVGSLRFKDPQPAESWQGIRDATSEGNSCAQIEPIIIKGYTGDEDCLFLNVYTPSIDGSLPVMVFVHGGGFRFGTGNPSVYGGDYLVEKDVVVVTLNYRLGPLGFLCLNTPEIPGNAGLKDVALALQWVKQNVKKFGGNAENLTVFGHSAGGALTTLLTISPLTKHKISKAIVQSGTALNVWASQKNPIDNATYLAKELGFESSDVGEVLKFLTNTPVKDLVEASFKINPMEDFVQIGKNAFAPVIEKEFPGVKSFLSEACIDIFTSGRMADIPMMVGTTTLEVAAERVGVDLQVYIPNDLNIERDTEESKAIAEEIKKMYFKGASTGTQNDKHQLLSDIMFNIDNHRYVKCLLNSLTKPIYLYKYDYIGEIIMRPDKHLIKYSGHGDELGYIFHMKVLEDLKRTPQDIKVKERLVRLWTNFAKEGNPTPIQSHYLNVTWPPINKDTLHYLNISEELSIRSDPDKEKMDFWENLYSKYYKMWDHPNINNEESPIISNIQSIRETLEVSVDKEETNLERKTKQKVTPENVLNRKTELNNVNHVIRANDPQEDDLPKNVGVNNFVNFYESLGNK